MEDMAYCGLHCDSCPVFNATISGDNALLARLAEEYSGEGFVITAEELECLGCHTGQISEKMCGGCGMRACGREKGVAHCGECAEYPCAIIEEYLPEAHPARAALEEYRANAAT